jgi:hypothetical protein
VNECLRQVKTLEPPLALYISHHTDSLNTTKHQQNTQLPDMASCASPTRYKFIFFTPPQYLDELKTAIFATGAGTYPNYSECMFVTPGVGQFRPMPGATPNIGTVGQLEEVGEVRCEMVCNGREITEKAIEALKK